MHGVIKNNNVFGKMKSLKFRVSYQNSALYPADNACDILISMINDRMKTDQVLAE